MDGLDLIAKDRKEIFGDPYVTKIVADMMLPKAMSVFEPTEDTKMYVQRLSFLGALIAATIDYVQNDDYA